MSWNFSFAASPRTSTNLSESIVSNFNSILIKQNKSFQAVCVLVVCEDTIIGKFKFSFTLLSSMSPLASRASLLLLFLSSSSASKLCLTFPLVKLNGFESAARSNCLSFSWMAALWGIWLSMWSLILDSSFLLSYTWWGVAL